MDDDLDEPIAQQNEHYAAFEPAPFAWLYIAVDVRDMGMTKVGLTKKEAPSRRIAEGRTYNPFLTLFATYELSRCSFGVSAVELGDIESYIHKRLCKPLKHLDSQRDSEWFYLHPEAVEGTIDWILAKRAFSVDGKQLYTFFDGPHNRHGLNIELMRKIKTIFRPQPMEFARKADDAGMEREQYQQYYEYLDEFHARSPADKVYLKEPRSPLPAP
jgi:hypothetical protein